LLADEALRLEGFECRKWMWLPTFSSSCRELHVRDWLFSQSGAGIIYDDFLTAEKGDVMLVSLHLAVWF